jgi:pyridoxamine 5'-phosphate oxidase-like protein
MTAHNLADLYDLPPLDLADVQADLARALTAQAPESGGPGRHSCWFTTINADGSPHLTGIGPLWTDGAFWICTGARSRKGRNLAREPRCALSVSTDLYDLTAEGSATLVTDPAVVAARAAEWAAGGWPCEVTESGTELTAPFSAPSAGPGPWAVYQMTVTSMHALGAGGPGGATRWSL